jgi:hypothetical protein
MLKLTQLVLVRNWPSWPIVMNNSDSAFENAISKCPSFQRLKPSKCRHIPVPSQYLSRKGQFWTGTNSVSPLLYLVFCRLILINDTD